MEKMSQHIIKLQKFKAMKNLLSFLLLSVFCYAAMAENQPKTVKPKIREVTVFFNGAQISSTADVLIPAGQSTIVFAGLPQNLNPQSVQVKGEGDFVILSVIHQINYLNNLEKAPEVSRLEDSVKILQNLVNVQQTMLNIFVQEESMLLANKVIGGEQNGTSITALREAMEYFRTRMTDIKNNQLSIQAKIAAYQNRMALLSAQLQVLSSQTVQPTSEIVVSVNSRNAVQVGLQLDYYAYNAGWKPTYDLRAGNINSPMELDFRANVFQTTGLDWKGVRLTLSTANPQQNGTRPVLNPWYLSIVQPYRYGYTTDEERPMATEAAGKPATAEDQKYKREVDKVSVSDYVSVNETQTNIEYEISLPYDIPADGKNYMVEIQKKSLPATYQYSCVPKLDNDVYLMARVSGWEQYNIISGEVNLFFEGTYVGKSYIDTRSTGDTLDFSLGKDRNIVVKREKLLGFSETRFIGLNKKETLTWEISIRNKKKQQITLVVDDQLPLSTDKDIVVEALEISGAQSDASTGRLSWKMVLNPSETKVLKLSYSVRYPKDKIVNVN